MKRFVQFVSIFLCIITLFGSAVALAEEAASLRVMSFNIRYNNSADGDNAWPNRKDMAATMILFHRADIVGIQEALYGQVEDLAERLPGYGWFGVGRDDGKVAGEFMAVFYRKDRVELIGESTFWLSESPETFGIGWDAVCNRVVTWGEFRDLKSRKSFFHFNTHFDHRGEVARRESAKLLLSSAAEISGSKPLLVTGDFNARPDSEPIQIITTGLSGMPETKLIDTKSVSKHGHHGPDGTWSGFKSAGKPGDEPIDYIFIKGGVKVIQHGTLSDSVNGRFPSDHMPVLVDVVVE